MYEIGSDSNTIDHQLAYSSELLGKECHSCFKVRRYIHFRKDTSYRDGHRDQCYECELSPRLSTLEHTARLSEMNNNSVAVQKQKFEGQDEDPEQYVNAEARLGQPMHHSVLLAKIHACVPNLYVIDGNIIGDLAVYQVFPQPQPSLDGLTHKYLWYVPTGWLPEYTIWEFDRRGIPQREAKRGWRTPLLRLIKAGLLSEEKSYEIFGRPHGPASRVWYRELWKNRNNPREKQP